VLDLDRGSRVIGDRSFSTDPAVITLLGRSYLAGMRDSGMKSTGKHFPGHGSVVADSHVDDVVDRRSLEEIRQTDMAPFRELMPVLDSLMIAHVVYPRVDERPAGYSSAWMQDILRGELGYGGVIFSDDLCMHAARVAGGAVDRARECLAAGCDLVLVCQMEEIESLMADGLENPPDASACLARLYGNATVDRGELADVDREGIREWGHWRRSLEQLGRSWS
jgi:beta-N-acetylhexosaminidase